ncbi:hypothetical protein [Paenibacillus sp. PAMC 26794]|uniref:hypothetical protein n=1 Tax=Paenibacillus sp. PAMC 26794 TaxID=1257080 RepID=UPI00030C3A98|nr:hypothetical protein [Paenibacillus sp. PAMC 26794]
MKKPMIGVLPLYDTDKKSYWMLPDYMNAIEGAGMDLSNPWSCQTVHLFWLCSGIQSTAAT